MNPSTHDGRSVGNQVEEQTIPGHINPDLSTLMRGISNINLQPQYHGVLVHQMTFGAPVSSNFYYPFVAPIAAPRVPVVPINYGPPDQLMPSYYDMPVFGGSFEESNGISYERSNGISYERRNAETTVGSSHRCPSESTSASVNPPVGIEHAYYRHPQYDRGNEFVSIANYSNERSATVGSGTTGTNLIHPSNYNGFIHGIHGVESFQSANAFSFDQTVVGNPLLRYMGYLAWNHSPGITYMYGHWDDNLHQRPQMQDMNNHCFQFCTQVQAPHFPLPRGAISIPMSSHVGPRRRGSSRQFRPGMNHPHPQTRGVPETMQIYCHIPFIRYIDEVAIINLPGHHTDHHSGMPMYINYMSYEELLSLGDRIGNVNSGLSEESIASQLRTRCHDLPSTHGDAQESDGLDEETVHCIICMDDYQNQEEIGCLDCGHDYHAECLNKWLLMKNVCPICKTQALPPS